MKDSHWKQLDRKTIYDSPHMKLYLDTVKLQAGVIIDDYSVVSFGDGVVIVATDTDNNLIMIREYKYAIDETILCLPAGGLSRGEDVISASIRELREETGYESSQLECVGYVNEYPSKASHKTYIIRAKDAVKCSDTMHEDTEQIEATLLIPLVEVRMAIYKNKIKSASTISACTIALPEMFSANYRDAW